MLTLRGEKSALWKAWRRKDQTTYECAVECRAVGQHWNNVKAIIRTRRANGEKITVDQWARQHAPVTRRWLDEFGDFANRWQEFVEAWRWSKEAPYAPERKVGLHSFLDLMLTKRRFDTISKARQEHFGTLGAPAAMPIRNSVPISGIATTGTIEALTPTNRLICGDVADMLRLHIPDGAADLAIADAPYWLSRYYRSSAADRNYALAGMAPRFDEDWDKFDSVEHYETVAEDWLMEIMRCLDSEGSAFIFGSYHNIGLINRICQINNIYIINEIAWVVRNSRPNAAALKLQASHHAILWMAKEIKQYRFNYRDCKRRDYPGDYFAERGKQLRDAWDIPVAPHENKNHGHPSPKPLAVYSRCLDVAGKVGGLMLDLFSGSGTGAVAAIRFGMESISIEREPRYCDMIRRRVADEIASERDHH